MSDTRFSNQPMVGSSVIPDEAIPLVEGDGRFLNDIKLPGMFHVAFLRSQHAHAVLKSIDTSRARTLPGVIKVLTGKELFGQVDPFRSMPNRFSGGESVQRLDALSTWPDSALFDAREKAALALVEAITLVHDGQVPDAVYRAAVTEFGEDGTAALIWVSTVINAYNRIAISTRMVPPSPAPAG